MNQLDVYYRALLNYRKLTTANHDCTAMRSAIASADAEKDKIVIKRAFCTIESDWVEAIENGLIHIEKAIKQERQFIRSNGEVVPIEKVKRVSKETTKHLARHSNLISNYEEGEDIIPDKLYMIERLNDYAVYENRFLYMLLCYLRDFVTIRYNDIIDLTHKYDATITLDKTVSNGRQKMKYSLLMHDLRRDDPYLTEHNPARDIIDRISIILKAIIAYLSTPLMVEVSKVAMLKPPITKTNVLKMDNDFKGAVALYDFIILYDKQGYNVEHKETVLNPFADELADEFAEAGSLLSFLAYEYGLGMKKELKESYLAEEERIRLEKIKERRERIETLKRKLQKTGEGLEDYVLTIEKQLRALDDADRRAEALTAENDELKRIREELNKVIDELNSDIVRLKEEFEEEKTRHFLEIEALKKAHEDAMHALILSHEAELLRIAEERRLEAERHREEIRLLEEKHAEEMRTSEERHAEEMRLSNERHAEDMRIAEERYTANITSIASQKDAVISDVSMQRDDALNKLREKTEEARIAEERHLFESAELTEAKRAAEARVKALGGVDRDYIDRDSFNELEREYKAFTVLYNQQWAKAKQYIRRKHLNLQNFNSKDDKPKNNGKE